MPVRDDAHRAIQGTPGIDLHPHAVLPVRVGQVDDLLAHRQPTERRRPHGVNPRTPGLGKTVLFK